ncbi:hypothetical protein SAMN05421774_102251 [Gemmobacter megaterium]|uniref:DUF1127 domain-containing protein n=1 Tax=Gemmobacter megaterium TaxID=1086013 RepID=A0A1N7LXZ0_9RHOB|nr:hypothetical protein [Gemmobacter megaterium]GGE10051.1 hypothetical protein GCM10011345_14860 [Gemmobacter megaterium]SIS78718.1 hypothetical protein SAMN05421774_102251 [Gemmobacter megaterium]
MHLLTIDDLIQIHGPRRVLFAALGAMFTPSPRLRIGGIEGMDDRLLRDIGLPPRSGAPPRLHSRLMR